MKRYPGTFCRVALLLTVANAAAQSQGGPYAVAPVAIANGGGTLGGGPFHMIGTFGQVATSTLSAPRYHIYGGFWAPPSDVIFANGFDQ